MKFVTGFSQEHCGTNSVWGNFDSITSKLVLSSPWILLCSCLWRSYSDEEFTGISQSLLLVLFFCSDPGFPPKTFLLEFCNSQRNDLKGIKAEESMPTSHREGQQERKQLQAVPEQAQDGYWENSCMERVFLSIPGGLNHKCATGDMDWGDLGSAGGGWTQWPQRAFPSYTIPWVHGWVDTDPCQRSLGNSRSRRDPSWPSTVQLRSASKGEFGNSPLQEDGQEKDGTAETRKIKIFSPCITTWMSWAHFPKLNLIALNF